MSVGHTCGLACWTAQDDVCHCSCGGINHGCMRGEGGVQPVRSRKFQGEFFELSFVCHGFKELMKLREEHPELFTGSYLRTQPSKAEVMKWPELASFRNQSVVERMMNPPICMWTRSTKYK